jgi:spermidine synthase
VEAVGKVIAGRRLSHLQYYNGETHRAAFALPNYVKPLVG